MKKNLLKYLLIFSLLCGLLVLWGFSIQYKMSQVCQDIRVEIVPEENNYFIGIERLREHLKSILYDETRDSRVLAKTMGEINLNEVEHLLESNPFIRNAEVFRRNGGVLEVRVQLRTAIARVNNIKGEAFYIDSEGKLMPLSPDYTPNVLLLSGKVLESMRISDTLRTDIGKALLPMLQHIHQDEFYHAQISEIVLDRDGNMKIYPEAGSIWIDFGTVARYTEKLENLLLFYRQVLNRTGWDRYRKVSVRYKGQVVAEKRNPFDLDISEYE
jgi:cell division protein FtsQ